MKGNVLNLKVLLLVCVLGILTLPAAAQDPVGIERLSWLAGSWYGEKDGVQAEELWIAPKAGVMLGLHRDVFASGNSFFEFLRIAETDRGLALFASPNGRSPTRFDMVSLSDRRVEFENPSHDFPQRIIYWLDDLGYLHARIEGSDQGREKHAEWVWVPDEE